MGNLQDSRVYLCGPIDKCKNNGSLWRDNITPFLEKLGVYVLNPLKKPVLYEAEDDKTRKLIEKLKNEGKYDEISVIVKNIRHVDLRMVDISDFLIVNLDLDIPICGTFEEIFISNRQKKPIIIHCPQGKNKIPSWLFGTLPHQMFFSNWYGVKEYISYIDSQKDIETYNRWVFFQLNNKFEN